jgi:chemotaxis protein methyltransferase CheR
MTLREAGCDAQVIASDIDTDALQTASSGVYDADRIADLPLQRLRAHFLKGTGTNEGWVTIRPELRGMVKFMQLNLQSPQWATMEPFDAIFCRNVAIYFDREAQKKLLERFTHVLRPGALLAVGHAESFPATHPAFRGCGRTAYEYQPG